MEKKVDEAPRCECGCPQVGTRLTAAGHYFGDATMDTYCMGCDCKKYRPVKEPVKAERS